jgi:hypothetical protein
MLISMLTEPCPDFAMYMRSNKLINNQKKRGTIHIAVTSGVAIFSAIDLETTDLNLGIARNLMQLEAVRDDKLANGIKLCNTMFGVVAIGDKWVITKVVFRVKGKPAVFVSRAMELSIGEEKPTKSALVRQIKLIHRCLVQTIARQGEGSVEE